MKKNTLLTLIALFAISTSSKVFAQGEKKNVVKINMFSLFAVTGSVFYERAFNDKVAGQLGLSYTGAKTNGTGLSGIGITPEVRFYLAGGPAPKGFFVGPFLRYRSLNMSATASTYDINGNVVATETAKGTWNQVGGGVVTGYHVIAGSGFSFDFFIGPAYYSNSFKYKDNSNANDFSLKGNGNFSIRSGLTLGWAF